MRIHTYTQMADVQRAAADRLNELIAEHHSTDLLLMVSGGSALALLDEVDHTALDRRVTLTVLDERYTEEEDGSNFAQLMAHPVFTAVKDRGVRTIGTVVNEGESLEQFAQRFEAALRAWKEEHPSGTVVATMGVGPDGHTAGVLPYPNDQELFTTLFSGEGWVAGYDATVERNAWPLRATTTLSFLRSQVDEAVVYAVGARKEGVVRSLVAGTAALHEMPASVLHEMRSVDLFTDISVEHDDSSTE